MNKKIIFALTSHSKKGNSGQTTGFYLSEASHPWAVFKAAGFEIDFVSPQGGKPPVDGVDMDDAMNRRFLEDADVTGKIANTLMPVQVNAADYSAIFFVGGHGTMWDFPDDKLLAQLAVSIYEQGGVVSAVCHGPAALVNMKLKNGEYLIKGKKVAAFTDDEERAVKLEQIVPFMLATTLQQRGAIHVAAENWQANVVVDGRLVTGQNPASAEGVGRAVAELLNV